MVTHAACSRNDVTNAMGTNLDGDGGRVAAARAATFHRRGEPNTGFEKQNDIFEHAVHVTVKSVSLHAAKLDYG